MKVKTPSKILLTLLLALAMAVPFLTMTRNASAASNAFFGAIFTSTSDGTTVNANIYDDKNDVYLNGGPQGMSNTGLPPGTYYFQVTDPSGATLLSTDPASCRQVTVNASGRIAGAAAASGVCAHPNGTFNPANGSTPVKLMPFNDTPNNGGEYKAWLIRQTSQTSIAPDGIHINFDSKDTKTDNFKVRQQECQDCNPQTRLFGRKFYDANASGVKDPGPSEPGIQGVRITICVTTDSGTTCQTVETDPAGEWSAEIPTGAAYTVCETLPNTCAQDGGGSYWLQTAPAADSTGARCYSGLAGGQDIIGLDFGDICFHPARGGLTLGFWSNKNGQAIMKANDNFASALAFLNGLPLKDYNGTNKDFDPNNYTQFRTWLLSGNAANMAYMLSVQLSVTSLDVRYGLLSDSQLVDATSLGLGIVSIGTLRAAAIAELNGCGNPCLTFSGNPLRADQEIIKDALDAINNNRLAFASSSPCGVCYPVIQ